MARIEPDALRDPEQVYVAGTLREARRLESVLTSQGVNYVTQVEVLGTSSLFGSLRHGVGFFVTTGQAAHCREALTHAGYTRGLVAAAESEVE